MKSWGLSGWSFLVMGTFLVNGMAECGEIRFEKKILSETFYSEGCALGDFNRDGKPDILAGSFWYENPSWTPHEIRKPGTFQFDKGYSDSFINFAFDVNSDGWDDAVIVGMPGEAGSWYENPKGKRGYWKAHPIHPSVCNESPMCVDIDGNGKPDLLFPSETDERWAWFSPPEPGGTGFIRHILSSATKIGTHRYAHGMGAGDINKDGRLDVLCRKGWWEAPEDPRSEDWKFRSADLGPPCAHMYVYDFDGDGDQDVVSSSAHEYGVWWYEQGQDDRGNTTWTQHEIDKTISQTHALCFVDMNGDGLPDLVTGKRFYAHNGHDPGAHEPAVLVWYELHRNDGKPSWTRHRIDDDSGVGTDFVVGDVNGDGKPDIVTSNKKGTHLFLQASDQ